MLRDLAPQALVRKRDIQAAGTPIKEAVRRMQDLGAIDSHGRRLKYELPPDMK